jgi:hypothetical protein
MNSKVIYLNAWLDCPDLILRRNYALQDKINEARIHFFYKLREEGSTEERAVFLYSVWIQKNRKRLRLVPNEVNSDDDGDLPASS